MSVKEVSDHSHANHKNGYKALLAGSGDPLDRSGEDPPGVIGERLFGIFSGHLVPRFVSVS